MSVIVLAVLALIAVVFLVVKRAGGSPSRQAAVTSTTSSQPSLTGVLASAVPGPSGAVSSGSGQSSPQGTVSGATTSTGGSATGSSGPSTTASSSTPSSSTPSSAAAGTTAAGSIGPAVAGSTATTGVPPKKPAPSTHKPPATTTVAATTKTVTKTDAPPATTKPTSKPPAPRPPVRPAAPATDAQGRLLCTDEVMKLQATTGAPSYRSGQQPVLGVTVSSTGAAACMRDLSGTLQVFSVYTAGGSRVWSTADCSPGTGTDVRQLQPGQPLQYNIKWSGTTSQPACAGDRLTVPPGHYQLRVTVGRLSATPVPFTLT